MTENEMREIYFEVQHEFYLEDARCFVTDYIADKLDCDPDDIEDEMLDKYDYEYLVAQYEKCQDCNVAFNDTWQSVVEMYMEDFEDDFEEM